MKKPWVRGCTELHSSGTVCLNRTRAGFSCGEMVAIQSEPSASVVCIARSGNRGRWALAVRFADVA